ncbi:hypothetical protein [uncultured Lentibacter sp.]|uniref:hypothetical protein n=1 Tax=uncultured Lentibacter sp. TaxID=1659309 RepID=UPI00261281B3|nr:hypothetical protein [uncultured Lentibacter sp.]
MARQTVAGGETINPLVPFSKRASAPQFAQAICHKAVENAPTGPGLATIQRKCHNSNASNQALNVWILSALRPKPESSARGTGFKKLVSKELATKEQASKENSPL